MRLKITLLFLLSTNLCFGQSVTYHDDIAPIIQKHCVACHQKGEVAPMAFTTYSEVSSYASMIAYVTGVKYMPPWKVVHPKKKFESERGLLDGEIQLIQQWIDDGLKEGESQDISLQNTPKVATQISNPDLVISMAEAFKQYGVYYDQFRVFVIPTHLKEDKEIEAIAFVPGNKNIVRNCHVSIDTSSKSKVLDDWDPQYGYFSFGELGFVPMESRWYNWHPGKPATYFPEGTGKLLPKGSNIMLHIHYGPTGFPQKDSSYIQLKFAQKKIKQSIFTAPFLHRYNMTNDTFFIPAGKTTRVHGKFVVPFDMQVYGVFPQSQLLGKKWEVFTVDPTSNLSESILKIEDWDFKWKQMYDFKKPKVWKKGTIIHALAAYDNTLENLSNPSNPPHDMDWGKRMFEDLFLVFFKYAALSSEENNKQFEIIFNQVNVTQTRFNFGIETRDATKLTGRIFSFDGEYSIPLFENQAFEKGKHVIAVDLRTAPKGNYYIQVLDTSTKEKINRAFFYLDDVLFE